jgi:hypothetical protein
MILKVYILSYSNYNECRIWAGFVYLFMFVLILSTGILAAVIQIIMGYYDLKIPDPQNPLRKKITVYGWVFYGCTIILAILPGIQKVWQDDIDEANQTKQSAKQDSRDSMKVRYDSSIVSMRHGYDTSIIEMKDKFDSSSKIVAEVLGKYGFKLDYTRGELVKISDSVKQQMKNGKMPVFQITGLNGIRMLDELPNGNKKFVMEMVSLDAGSSYFDINCSYVVSDSKQIYYAGGPEPYIDYQSNLSEKDIQSTYFNVSFFNNPNISAVYVWIRGSYKRPDGSGDFKVNSVYGYFLANKRTMTIKGPTKKIIVDLINSKEH